MKGLRCTATSILIIMFGLSLPVASADNTDQEYITTTPILANGILYTASFTRPGQAGHLRATDLTESSPRQLWDAAKRMPAAGLGAAPGDLASSDPPTLINPDNLYRFLFTTEKTRTGIRQQSFTPLEATALQPALHTISTTEARMLINQTRGRSGVTEDTPDGTDDQPHRLWGISRSTPAVVGRSLRVTGGSDRSQVIYAGAEDGLLHAFYGGRWQPDELRYNQESPAAGQELWGYLPGHLLPSVGAQPFDQDSDRFAIHVDGAPVVSDLYADWNGNGRCQWCTFLAGTASQPLRERSLLFALDISDPTAPAVLWEKPLPGTNPGLTRGVLLGTPETEPKRSTLFLTTAYAVKTDAKNQPDPVNGSFGIRACAIDPLGGRLLWEWHSPYAAPLTEVNTTPAIPALLDVDGNRQADYLVFGDMAGRLWALDTANGIPLCGGPIFEVDHGATQPIGAGVATFGRLVVFGTGGAAHADPNGQYALYAVEVLPNGAQLRWSWPLGPGEQVWAAPRIDQVGRIYFAASSGSLPTGQTPVEETSGRLIILDKQGEPLAEALTDSAIAGQVQISDGSAVAVSLSGRVYQFGKVQRRPNPADHSPRSLELFSWRIR